MTSQLAILVDFENVQPTVEELSLLHGSQHQLVIFHGPHQNKFDAAMVKALQPLGEQVDYVQCGRNGKNALDFHIAFYLGRLVRDGEREGGSRDAQYLIVSKDSGFEALIEHLNSLGHVARMVPSVGDAVAVGTSARLRSTPESAPETLTASATSVATIPKPAATDKPVAKSPSAPTKQAAPTLRDRLLENLRAHPKNRPSSRLALQRHISTLAGNEKPSAKTIDSLIAGLDRDGIVTIEDKKVVYAVPKKAK